MKIRVVPRFWIEEAVQNNPDFIEGKWIISIFSHNDVSPVEDRFNVLKLCFDDVIEKDTYPEFIHFNEEMAESILNFVKKINDDGQNVFYVHCDAGVSRSGAVGYMLNEYFNKYLDRKDEDTEFFQRVNSNILPNPEVARILKNTMFGGDYRGVFVNDYEYNEEGERINHVKEL